MDIKGLKDNIINNYKKDIYGNFFYSGDIVIKDYMYDRLKLSENEALFDYSQIYDDVLTNTVKNLVAAVIHVAPSNGNKKTAFILYELFLFGVCENFRLDNYASVFPCLHLYQDTNYGFLPCIYDKPYSREYNYVKMNFNDLNKIYFKFNKKIFKNPKVENDFYNMTPERNFIYENDNFIIPFNKCNFYHFYKKRQKSALTRASWKKNFGDFPKLYLKYSMKFENAIDLNKSNFFDFWTRPMLLYCAHPKLPHIEVIYKQFIEEDAFKLK